MTPKYIDLHTHTMYSDGIETPKILVQNLKLNGIDIAAKTDHDTIAGYWEFKKAADAVGLITIPGIEFSDRDYHILGLGFNPDDAEFNRLIKKSEYFQRLTTEQRVELLHEHSIPVSMEKIDFYFPSSRLGKQNIFRTLYNDEECRQWLERNLPGASPKDVFEYTLRKKGVAAKVPHYYDLERYEIFDGIHKAGGIAIPAHLPKDIENINELDELRYAGADGFEIQPNFYEDNFDVISYQDVKDYATKHNMLITYGSDYHGSSMPRSLLGRSFNVLSQDLEERLFQHDNTDCKEACLK
ncbi:MAG: PHP domain-containing protein [Candidatus Nanoarchaeia archaeon]|nr:PHP domain-containing protein [Candidatus Nanoarchaeia archaeon]MDD5740575.1 PHP domain-containing protein [Candidatus Nanoarchaeia archaeon]